MTPVRNSPHFVPLGRVPLVDDMVHVASAFAAAAAAGAGGFILRQRAEPRFYIVAGAFAQEIEARFGGDAWEKIGSSPGPVAWNQSVV